VDELEIKDKIHEIKGYIASNWPGIEERKHLNQRLSNLERLLKKINEKADNKQEKNKET
jgi:hypothetical protein